MTYTDDATRLPNRVPSVLLKETIGGTSKVCGCTADRSNILIALSWSLARNLAPQGPSVERSASHTFSRQCRPSSCALIWQTAQHWTSTSTSTTQSHLVKAQNETECRAHCFRCIDSLIITGVLSDGSNFMLLADLPAKLGKSRKKKAIDSTKYISIQQCCSMCMRACTTKTFEVLTRKRLNRTYNLSALRENRIRPSPTEMRRSFDEENILWNMLSRSIAAITLCRAFSR